MLLHIHRYVWQGGNLCCGQGNGVTFCIDDLQRLRMQSGDEEQEAASYTNK
jgi:hypothetical protein